MKTSQSIRDVVKRTLEHLEKNPIDFSHIAVMGSSGSVPGGALLYAANTNIQMMYVRKKAKLVNMTIFLFLVIAL